VVTPDKLWFLQKRHAARYASISPEKEYNPSHDLRKLAVEPVLKLLSQFSAEQPHNFVYYLSLDDRARAKYVQDIVYIDALSCNYTTPFNCVTRNKHFFVAPTPEDLANSISIFKLRGVPSDIKSAVPTHKLLRSVANFAEIPEKDWNTDAIKSWTNSIIGHGSAESLAELPGIVFEEAAGAEALVKKAWSRLVHGYIRWALMGGMPGPDGAETMRMLGKEETMRRFDAAREVARNRMENEWSGSMDV
jgi:glutamyl-tRNA synthetase